MARYVFILLIAIHGLIHFMGFAKAFNYGNITQLTKNISKQAGMFWMLTALLFIATAILFLIKKDVWPIAAILATIISQVLIIMVWKDAKFGTVANFIILIASLSALASTIFENKYKADVKRQFATDRFSTTEILYDTDISNLPIPVQKYIRYSGAIGKPKVKNMRVVLAGEMRDKGKDYFKFTTEQYNFFDDPARLFFMKAKMYGTIVPGYHCYQKATASMQVKLLGLFDVVNVKGSEMNKAETVTVFNDMCLMAPATLIDKRIEWTTIDNLSAKAIFTNQGIKISTILYFNEMGQLVNFISDDRYAINDMKQYRFSTPIKTYKKIGDRIILQYGEGVWHYPEGEFVYGKFNIISVEYNITKLE
jgi:predicted nucleic acid-binding protein